MPSSVLRSMIVSMLLGVVTSTTGPLQFTKTANSTEVGQARQKNLRERAMERDVEVEGGISCQSEYATFESLRSEASAVVYGRIIESKSFFDESGHPIEYGENITTEYSVEVLTVLKDMTFRSAKDFGRALPAPLATPLKIARNGGAVYVNGHRASVKVKGFESLEVGKKYVFFLFWSSAYKAYVLAGGLSGVMLVNDDLSIKPLAASEAIKLKAGRLDLESLASEVIDAPTLDYDTEITREKSNSRKAKDERFRGRGNPNSNKPIFELPQGTEPLPSNVHWWIELSALPVDQSDVIVLGKVVERAAHLTEDRTGIYSEFALQVEDVFKDKSGSVKSSEPLVVNRAGGNVRFASGKVQRYVISGQGMPLKETRYVLFLRSTSDGDLMILTGFELSNGRVIPLDGEDTQDVRAALPFTKYRNLGEFLFLADLHEALANSNMGLVGDTYSQALQVLAVETTASGRFRILFKNVSLKDVNGYVVAVGDNGRITTDLSTGDRVMPPGKTDDLEIPARETTPHIAVLATMFADGSIEGDPAIVTELTEWRSGIKLQLTRALKLVEAALQAPDVNTSIALDRLESQLSSLSVETDTISLSSSETQEPDQEEARLTYRVISGLRSARDDLLTNIRLIRERVNKHGTHRQGERLLELKQRIERRIARI